RLRRLSWLGPFVDLAVAVGVKHEWRPALCLGGIAGLVPHLGVDPAGYHAGAGEPQCVVGVVAELRMVSPEASIDEAVLHCLGIEHRYLPPRLLERKHFGRRMVRTLLAECWIIDPAHGRGKPHPAALVEHAVVIVGALVP